MAELRIKPQRLTNRLAELGQIGETPQGMMRLAFSPEDLAGRKYVSDLMKNAGMKIRIDSAGNLIGLKPGTNPDLPSIAVGSHTDTVPHGGKYDGALGVLSAIECVNSLKDLSIMTRHNLEIIDFTNEEGTGYGRWLYGSRAMTGLLEDMDLSAEDEHGISIGSRLQDVGGDIRRIHEAERQPGAFAAYLELHIEQGPVLHNSGTPIGKVTSITGRISLNVNIRGFANHAGTTPMSGRRDALLSASKIIQAVNSIATDEEICRVGTVGIARISPGADNVIPGQVMLSVEFRDENIQPLLDAETRITQLCQQESRISKIEIEIFRIGLTHPSPMDSNIQQIIDKSAHNYNLETKSLPSGAGHDAQSMATLTPSGMIFVPSIDGISHSPNEYSSPESCSIGANVLLSTILAIDQRF